MKRYDRDTMGRENVYKTHIVIIITYQIASHCSVFGRTQQQLSYNVILPYCSVCVITGCLSCKPRGKPIPRNSYQRCYDISGEANVLPRGTPLRDLLWCVEQEMFGASQSE